MAKFDYAILDAIARQLHNVEDSVNEIGAELGNCYPDNSREGNVQDLLELADTLIAEAAKFKASLSTIRPESGPDRAESIFRTAPNSDWHGANRHF